MKKIIKKISKFFFLLGLLMVFSFVVPSSVSASCLTVEVSFPDIPNWPGGDVEVACRSGFDVGFPDPTCVGDEARIRPGRTVALNNCDCIVTRSRGEQCFYIKKIPDQIKSACDVNVVGDVCQGQNGDDVPGVMAGSCRVPENPTEKPGEENPTPEEGKKPTATPKEGRRRSTPTPKEKKPGEEETPPEESPGPNETPGPEETPGPNETPGPETPGPHETPPPGTTFTPVPSSRVTPSVTPRLSSSVTPGRPTPTPTPAFSPAMCKCNNLTADPIFEGSSFSVTANGKVEGQDKSLAKIEDIAFIFLEGTRRIDSTKPGQPIKAEEKPAGSGLYSATWTSKAPDKVKPGVKYRIISTLNCKKKSPSVKAAATTASEGDIFAQIGAFFASLFGNAQENLSPATLGPTQSPKPKTTSTENLKAKPLYTAVVTSKNVCNSMTFEFPSADLN